jgi:lysozyme
MMKELIEQLAQHEGERLHVYTCSAGYETIGIGRNISDTGKGITKMESHYLLMNDIAECKTDLQEIFPNFDRYSETRRIALVDMRMNLGPSRFRSFKKMIAFIKKGDWLRASCEALDSRWATQVQKSRVNTITKQMGEG